MSIKHTHTHIQFEHQTNILNEPKRIKTNEQTFDNSIFPHLYTFKLFEMEKKFIPIS